MNYRTDSIAASICTPEKHHPRCKHKRGFSEPRTQRSGVSVRRTAAYSAALRARLGNALADPEDVFGAARVC